MSNNSNESKHLDKLVIYLFIGAFLISAVTLAFRYTKYAPCEEILFTVDSSSFRAGELIKFSDETEGAKSWKWEFGDSSEVKSLKSPLHYYKEAGEYEVKLIVNNICEQTKMVTIKEKIIVRDSTRFPKFSLPESIKVGEVLKVMDETENADTWEWRFGDNAGADAKTRRAEYVYEEPGLRSVRLIVNGDEEYISVKKINVLPINGEKSRITEIDKSRDKGWNVKKAPTGGPEPVAEKEKELKGPSTAPIISDRELAVKLQMIADGIIKPESLRENFCGVIDLPIIENGKKTSFLLLCENIREKKLKNLEVTGTRTKSNCITNLTVRYKKGWF